MENNREKTVELKETPAFLKSVVVPTDTRVSMKGTGKMCSCFSYGN
ncbi:hypothetical protein ACWF82_28785 [Nocardia sp. NPDC055053]